MIAGELGNSCVRKCLCDSKNCFSYIVVRMRAQHYRPKVRVPYYVSECTMPLAAYRQYTIPNSGPLVFCK